MRNRLFWLCLMAIGVSLPLDANPAKRLTDELNPRFQLDLKWQAKIGKTTYRTNLILQNEKLVFGSNGQSLSKINDRIDGLYIVNPHTGEIEKTVLDDTKGDRDVNGVAATSQRIFWGDDNNSFQCISWNGQPLWGVGVGGDIENAPAIEDFNADGQLDVCFSTEAGELYVLDGRSGRVLWGYQAEYQPTWTYPSSRSFMSAPALYDINRDGIRDVLIGNRNGRFVALDGKTGSVVWEIKTQTPSGIFSSATVANDRIYFAESYNTVYEVNGKGAVLKKHTLDTDGIPRLFASPVVTPAGSIVIGSSGTNGKHGVWIITKTDRHFHAIGKVSASAAIADILGKGTLQIIVMSESGWLYVFSEEGEVMARFSLPYGGEATPVVDDIDFDGKLELLLFTSDQFLACYDTPSQGAVYLSGFRGNPYNTGVINDVIDSDLEVIQKGITANRKGKGYTEININTDNEFLITPHSIGNARIGMTFGKLKAVLGPNVYFQDVDLGIGMKAKAVIIEGDVQYYIFYPSWGQLQATDVISVLGTNNPKYETAEGIHAESHILHAEKVYGDALLSYHTQNSREELIQFANKPKTIWFAQYGDTKAGLYKSEKSFNTTRKYDPSQRIQFIGVKR